MKQFLIIATIFCVALTVNAQSTYYRGSLTTPGGDLIFFFTIDNNVSGEPLNIRLKTALKPLQDCVQKKVTQS
jgi:hypothetical protein